MEEAFLINVNYLIINKCKEILEREKLEKLEKNNKSILLKEKLNKMNSYGKMVKEIYWPPISELKKKEMILLKNKLSKRESRNKNHSISPINLPPFVKLNEGMTNKEEDGQKPGHTSRLKNKLQPSTKKKCGKSLYSIEKEKVPKEEKIQYKNYLMEFKRKNILNQSLDESEDENEAFTPYWDWKTIDKDSGIDEESKVVLLKEKAHMLQERSELKEKMLDIG